jgi:hypothetical protein
MTSHDELNDPDSPLVRDALTRKCHICAAVRGEPCRPTIKNQTALPGRLVHIERTTP